MTNSSQLVNENGLLGENHRYDKTKATNEYHLKVIKTNLN